MIGAFCFEDTWMGWSSTQLTDELGSLRELGVEGIVTETVEAPADLIRAARELGLQVFVSVPCFSAHGWPHLIEGLDVHPIQADGQPRRQMEWYTGLIPTHAGYNEGLMRRILAIAEARPTGVILDFIRWPLHWELELRAGASEPDESSFDPTSMAAFAAWLEQRGAEALELQAAELTGPLRASWTDFKCDVITRFACRATEAVQAVDPGILVGAFIVPGSESQRRRLLGQDVAALGACVDLLLLMTYHGILHEPVDFIGHITTDVQARTAARVVPVVQVTAEPSVAGPWDWGREVAPHEFARAVEEALHVAPDVVLFPFEGLDAARRERLPAVLRQASRRASRPPGRP